MRTAPRPSTTDEDAPAPRPRPIQIAVAAVCPFAVAVPSRCPGSRVSSACDRDRSGNTDGDARSGRADPARLPGRRHGSLSDEPVGTAARRGKLRGGLGGTAIAAGSPQSRGCASSGGQAVPVQHLCARQGHRSCGSRSVCAGLCPGVPGGRSQAQRSGRLHACRSARDAGFLVPGRAAEILRSAPCQRHSCAAGCRGAHLDLSCLRCLSQLRSAGGGARCGK